MTTPLTSLLLSTPPPLSSIPPNHLSVGASNLKSYSSLLSSLLSERALPARGFTVLQINYLLAELTLLDTNNSPANVGVGEREGRVYSALLRDKPAAHGVGRSGDLLEPQPKSVGTSILVQITYLCLQSLLRRTIGLDFVQSAAKASNVIILPLCTGKSIEHSLLWLRKQELDRRRKAGEKPGEEGGVVLWCRIDQKSCLKSIMSACLTVVVIETLKTGDLVKTSVPSLLAALELHGDRAAAVVSCTSCFAPRSFDAVDEIAKLAATFNVPHIINNAYGLYCRKVTKIINRATKVGRVDLVVSSLDKNFMVPVGG